MDCAVFSRRPYPRHTRGRVSSAVASAGPWWPGQETPIGAYLASTDEYADVGELGDDSGNGLVLTSTAGALPTYTATACGGEPGILFASNDALYGESAADWAALHSGQCTLLGRDCAGSALNFQSLLSTYTTVTPTGLRVLFHGSIGELQVIEYNAGATVLSQQTSGAGLSVGTAFSWAVRIDRAGGSPHCEIWVNGSLVKSGDYTGSNATGSPGQAMNIAKQPGTGNNFTNGATHARVVYDTAISDETLAAWWTATPATSHRTLRVFRWLDHSKGQSAASWRRKFTMRSARTSDQRIHNVGSQTPTGNHPLADKRHDAIYGETLAQIEARVAGYSGEEPTDVAIMGAANSLTTLSAADTLTAMGSLISAVKVRHPGSTVWIISESYGDGTSPTYTAAGAMGTYNAGLPALCASLGVNHVDIHSGAYAWVPGTHALDGIGHENAAGGDAIGNTLAVAVGYGGD